MRTALTRLAGFAIGNWRRSIGDIVAHFRLAQITARRRSAERAYAKALDDLSAAEDGRQVDRAALRCRRRRAVLNRIILRERQLIAATESAGP